jgi:hypothetical protein
MEGYPGYGAGEKTGQMIELPAVLPVALFCALPEHRNRHSLSNTLAIFIMALLSLWYK